MEFKNLSRVRARPSSSRDNPSRSSQGGEGNFGRVDGARGDSYPRDRFGARLLETRDQEPEKFLAKFDFVYASTGGTLEIFRSVLHREYYNFEIAGQPSNSLSNLFEICSIYEILQSTK